MKPADLWWDFAAAVQFLTRIPMPFLSHRDDTLARAAKFFPVVGALVGGMNAVVLLLLRPHVPALVAALLTLVFSMLLTGCLHEDALADAADGVGGGWTREQVLRILRDSRVGSYGAAALVVSIAGRCLLLAALPHARVVPALLTAHVLCRWSMVPLGYFLPAARTAEEGEHAGQGARVAGSVDVSTLLLTTIFSWALALALLRWRGLAAIAASAAITLASGTYYKRRIGGVTGDCFGATNQLAEMAVYLCGVWV